MTFEEFLDRSLTSYHATRNCEEILNENGFQKLSLTEKWNLQEGGKYYLIKNQSALIAFKIGDLKDYIFNIQTAHTDSPSLKVKGDKLIDSMQGKRINVEEYGSAILYSFFDRPLKIAGRLLVENNGKIEGKIVESKNFVTIPSLAIHQNRVVNDGIKISIQNDMLPLVASDSIESVYDFFDEKNIIDADLYLVPKVPAYYSGFNNEYINSARLDNLTGCYSILEGLKNCKAVGISLGCLFDNEEIGSATKQGANSSLINSILVKINSSLSKTEDDLIRAYENGFMLSIDNAHATHPAHAEKSDLGLVKMGEGLVIKHNIKYTTDGYSSALLKILLKKNKIKYQDFYCHSDMRSGSTLGLFISTRLNINSVDIGLCQLAMHSACEMMKRSDIEELITCSKLAFETNFNCEN